MYVELGRRIYYDKTTGNIIADVGERAGYVTDTTVEQDFAIFSALSERDPETVGHIQLEYGDHAEDFNLCNGLRVNPVTEALEFSYPEPGGGEPVFQKPLKEQLDELKAEKEALQARVQSTEDAILMLMDLSMTP